MKKLLLYIQLLASFNLTAQTNNYSLEFYGTNDVVNVPDNGSLNVGTSDFSICFWIKTNNSSMNNPEYILGKRFFSLGGGYSIYVRNDGLVRAEINDSNSGTDEINVSTSILDNQWHFFTAVYDRDGNCDVYMDGTKENSVSIVNENSNIDNSNPFFVGYFEPGNDRYFDGALDEIHIWNIALDSISINNFMICPPSGTETNLLGYWNFEEGTGTITADQTTNANDGTLNGGVTWSTDVPPYNCCTANPITSQPTDQTVNMGNNATFTFTDSLTAATYQWQLDAGTGYTNLSNAGQFSGTDTKTLTVSAVTMSNNNTNYRCLVTESSSCSDTTDVANLTVSSVNSINEYDNAAVKIYPNPTNGWFTLSLSNTTNGRVVLTDLLSKEVLIKSFTSNEVQLNLKSLEATGTYFAKVLDADGNVIAIRKLIYQ